MLSHSLEKGLALPSPRPGFAKDKVEMLLGALERYLDEHGCHQELASIVGALDAYFAFNESTQHDVSDLKACYLPVRSRIESSMDHPAWAGGTVELEQAEVWREARMDLEPFFSSRHSVRQFGPEPIDRKDIEWAVRMAQRSPSVCNRQSGRVHVLENDDLGRRVLECQTGNRGFGHQASKVLIVTVDLRRFLSIGERNQCWVDGGLFAMTLIWALHSRGIGSCCLNWSADMEQDQRLRQVADIEDWENVITLIAVGSLPERFPVASSPRRDLESILVFREQANKSGGL
jgi:nitroreductase